MTALSACERDPDVQEQLATSSATAALNGGSCADAGSAAGGCRSVKLVASRRYRTGQDHWSDAEESFVRAFAFSLPSEVPVTVGNAGNKHLTIAYWSSSQAPIVCRYDGGASTAHPTTPTEIAKGQKYLLRSCTNGARAGDAVTVNWIGLHVDNGDSQHPARKTEVTLTLTERGCTAPDGGAPDSGPDASSCTASSCNDNNPCTIDSCGTNGACVHAPASSGTSCSDGNACNGAETCNGSGVCTPGAAPTVDDGNACTTDSCDPQTGVKHEPVAQGVSCSDGNACNGAETCNGAGTCVSGTSPPVDDNNPCTVDSCDPQTGVKHVAAADGTSCSDGNACNGDELCASGACRTGTAPTIDDGNACTTDSCDPQNGVQHAPVAQGTSCSDANACNGAETCNGAGTCSSGPAPTVDDGNPCTRDSCDPQGGVKHEPVAQGTSCSDGNACNGAEACDGAGACASGTAPVVDDGNPCTVDTCDPQTGVKHVAAADGTACSDGNACNGAETCASGACKPGTAPTVDDGNACTTDTCDPQTGVTHTPVSQGTSCSDGNACNGTETCNGAGVCSAGTAPNVDDNNPCTVDSCDPQSGVKHVAAAQGTSCSDGNACNGAELCDGAGSCAAGTSPVVDDGNPCTVDSCDPNAGVQHVAVADGTSCSDGNACNGAETCGSGACQAGTAPVVDDNNACTADSCDPKAGVQHVAVAQGTSCSDGNACNGAETCDGAGACVSGAPPALDDGNSCTVDTCDPQTGVKHTAVAKGTSCSDGNVCNGAETCDGAGTCEPGTALVIDDSNPCTADACDPQAGVSHTPLAEGASCSDGNACNGAETCNGAGTCQQSNPPAIDDNNPCTTDACDPQLGVTHTAVANGTSCSDNNVCNGEERCSAGQCLPGTALPLDDGNSCTTDACDPQTGVSHTPIPKCDPAPSTEGEAFEIRASLIGKVVTTSGAPASGYTVKAYDGSISPTSQPRSDVVFTTASDGSFRVRLSSFPTTESDRAPPQHIIVHIDGANTLTAVRDAHLHPGGVVNLGTITVVERDPKVNMIGAAGGTARDSQDLIEVVFPPGALPQDTPVRITPLTKREQLTYTLPDQTLTGYGLKLEPNDIQFPAGLEPTVRVRNTRGFPTSLEIPVGYADRFRAVWTHEGVATWDGQRWAFKTSHFSTFDVNPNVNGAWVAFLNGQDRSNGPVRCGGSGIGIANGALQQTFSLPTYRRMGRSYGVGLSYDSFFAFGATSSSPVSGFGAVSRTPMLAAGSSSTVSMSCLPRAQAERAASSTPGACVTGASCAPGVVSSVPPMRVEAVSSYGDEFSVEPSLPTGAVDIELPTAVSIPIDANGDLVPPHFVQSSVRVMSTSSSACASSGGTFGSNISWGSPSTVTTDPSVLASDVHTTFVPHRRSSPYGIGWGIEGVGRVYQSPFGVEAYLLEGASGQEHFVPRAVAKPVKGFNGFSRRVIARDATTGELFVALPGGTIEQIDLTTGTETPVFTGLAFVHDPMAMTIAYVGAARHFVVVTEGQLVDVDAQGVLRSLVQRPGFLFGEIQAWKAPGIAARGEYAYYVNGNPANPVLSRFKLSDPTPAEEVLSRASGGDVGLLPKLPLGQVTFGEPHGLAFGPKGELYLADRTRNVVYLIHPNATGEIASDSKVAQAVGDGAGRSVSTLGARRIGYKLPITNPVHLSMTDSGHLWIASMYGAVIYDTASREAMWWIHDGRAPKSELTFRLLEDTTGDHSAVTTIVGLDATDLLFLDRGSLVRIHVDGYSSERDPTRTLTFPTPTTAVLTDTTSDLEETYSVARPKEFRLIERRTRGGDPLLSVTYKDAKSERIDQILDPTGAAFTFAYDAKGKLASITDSMSRVTRITVNADGDLTSFTEPDGETHAFTYGAHRMESKTSPKGDVTAYTYAPDGALKTSTKPAGQVFTLTAAAMTAPLQRDAQGRSVRVGQYIDARGVTHTIVIDDQGQELRETYVADGVSYEMKTFKYDTLGGGAYVMRKNTTLGRVSKVLLNGLIQGLETFYDEQGRVSGTSKRPPGGGGVLGSYSYDADGRLSRFYEGPGNNFFDIDRDTAGRIKRIYERDAFQRPTGRESRYTWRTDGLPDTDTFHGVTTTYGYDAQTLNLTSATDSIGRSTALAYDAYGNVSVSSDGQTSTAFTYDANNRVSTAADANGNTTTLGYQLSTQCGCSERSLVTTIHTPDMPSGVAWRMQYGAEGRLSKLIDPDGKEESYEYEPTGELKKLTDRLNRTTTITHDALGRVKTVVDALARVHQRRYPVPTASKWVGPNLLGKGGTDLTAALGNGDYQIGENGYDADTFGAFAETRSRGFKQVTLYRDATFELSFGHAWDDAGRLTRREDRIGMSISSDKPFATQSGETSGTQQQEQFGWSNELPHAQLASYSSSNQSAGYGWNTEYDYTSSSGFGRNEGIESTFGRDVAGRLKSIRRDFLFDGGRRTGPGSTYDYYPNGYVKQVINADGTHDLAYDSRGRLRTITIPGEGVYTFDYDVAGRNSLLTYPDGHTREQLFDTQGRITSRCYQYSNVRRCYTARYDAVGNPIELTDPDGTDVFTYDNLDRLKSHTRGTEVDAYDYNALGALKINAGATLDDQRTKLAGGGTADAAVPANLGGKAVTTDPVGRITSLKGVSLQYNAKGRLVRVTRPDGQAESFDYDAEQRRVRRRRTNGTTTLLTELYVYEGHDLVAVTDATGAATESYLFEAIDRPLRIKRGTTHVYYELDLTNNVRRLRDATGAELGGYRYGAFGATKANTATFDQPLRWQGRWFEGFAGIGDLYDVRARWWSPELGIFLQIDEFRFLESTSTLWGWPGNNPIAWSDPTGRVRAPVRPDLENNRRIREAVDNGAQSELNNTIDAVRNGDLFSANAHSLGFVGLVAAQHYTRMLPTTKDDWVDQANSTTMTPAACFEVGPTGANLNSNAATSRFGIYEIRVNGSLHKVGKADLNRVTKSSGLPTRLHQQVRKLREIFGKGNVTGEVVQDLGETTTAAAKEAENARLDAIHRETGAVPPGNQKSYRVPE